MTRPARPPLGAFALLLGLYACAGRYDEGAPPPPPPPALPALPDGSVRCAADADARYIAKLALARAQARIQRSPFSEDGGVGALDLLAHAMACFEAAGDERSASAVRRRATRWRALLSRRYQSLRLRMRRALLGNDLRAAADAARRLHGMVGSLDTGYARYLRSLQQPGET